MNAGLIFRRIENKLCLAALLRDRVVALNCYLPKGIAICGETVTEDGVVDRISKKRDCNQRRKTNHQQPPKKGRDFGVQTQVLVRIIAGSFITTRHTR